MMMMLTLGAFQVESCSLLRRARQGAELADLLRLIHPGTPMLLFPGTLWRVEICCDLIGGNTSTRL